WGTRAQAPRWLGASLTSTHGARAGSRGFWCQSQANSSPGSPDCGSQVAPAGLAPVEHGILHYDCGSQVAPAGLAPVEHGILHYDCGSQVAPAGLAPVEHGILHYDCGSQVAPAGLAPVEHGILHYGCPQVCPAPAGLAPVERRLEASERGPVSPSLRSTGASPAGAKRDVGRISAETRAPPG